MAVISFGIVAWLHLHQHAHPGQENPATISDQRVSDSHIEHRPVRGLETTLQPVSGRAVLWSERGQHVWEFRGMFASCK